MSTLVVEASWALDSVLAGWVLHNIQAAVQTPHLGDGSNVGNDEGKREQESLGE